MGKLFPPFKVDIAGALCVPFTLRDARNRYQHGQISLSALRAIENVVGEGRRTGGDNVG